MCYSPQLTLVLRPRLSTHLQMRTRPERCVSLDLATELGPEALGQGRDDAVPKLRGILVGERPIR
jgi:hypothetical protein